eukprot:g1665.t1
MGAKFWRIEQVGNSFTACPVSREALDSQQVLSQRLQHTDIFIIEREAAHVRRAYVWAGALVSAAAHHAATHFVAMTWAQQSARNSGAHGIVEILPVREGREAEAPGLTGLTHFLGHADYGATAFAQAQHRMVNYMPPQLPIQPLPLSLSSSALASLPASPPLLLARELQQQRNGTIDTIIEQTHVQGRKHKKERQEMERQEIQHQEMQQQEIQQLKTHQLKTQQCAMQHQKTQQQEAQQQKKPTQKMQGLLQTRTPLEEQKLEQGVAVEKAESHARAHAIARAKAEAGLHVGTHSDNHARTSTPRVDQWEDKDRDEDPPHENNNCSEQRHQLQDQQQQQNLLLQERVQAQVKKKEKAVAVAQAEAGARARAIARARAEAEVQQKHHVLQQGVRVQAQGHCNDKAHVDVDQNIRDEIQALDDEINSLKQVGEAKSVTSPHEHVDKDEVAVATTAKSLGRARSVRRPPLSRACSTAEVRKADLEECERRSHAAQAIRAALKQLSCEGVLYKRGGGTRLTGSTNWRPRFFRLQAATGMLEYSDVKINSKLLPGPGKRKGSIPLSGVEVRKLGMERKDGGFTSSKESAQSEMKSRLHFRLWHRARRGYDLRAQSAEDLERWIMAIDEVTNLLSSLEAMVGKDKIENAGNDDSNRRSTFVRSQSQSALKVRHKRHASHAGSLYEVLFTDSNLGLELAGGGPTIVLHLFVDSFAERAGVTRGSELLRIGDEDVSALGFRECIQKIQRAGRPLRLTLRHADTESIGPFFPSSTRRASESL